VTYLDKIYKKSTFGTTKSRMFLENKPVKTTFVGAMCTKWCHIESLDIKYNIRL